MVRHPPTLQSRRRTGRRYTIVLFIVVALIAGWAWAWRYAAAEAETAVEGWRAREAAAGRGYSCGAQSVGGFPFRIEVNCDRASAMLHSDQTPLEIKAPGIVVQAQLYRPDRLTSEFIGPLTIAEPGQRPIFAANWTFGQSTVTGTPRAPETAALIFDRPTVDRINNSKTENLLSAKRIEIHGRIAAGSAADHPVIEVSLHAERASAPGLHPAAQPPIDADVTLVLRGLNNYAPKPWPARFRELQAAGGRIDITQVRLRQGNTLAVAEGSLSIDGKGQLAGELRVTVAGLEPFLAAIGAAKTIQKSHGMDKFAGMLDRLAPGLGDVARQQAGANLGLGIKMLGQPATLDGREAVTLPLRFTDGTAYFGPIPLGSTPALF